MNSSGIVDVVALAPCASRAWAAAALADRVDLADSGDLPLPHWCSMLAVWLAQRRRADRPFQQVSAAARAARRVGGLPFWWVATVRSCSARSRRCKKQGAGEEPRDEVGKQEKLHGVGGTGRPRPEPPPR